MSLPRRWEVAVVKGSWMRWQSWGVEDGSRGIDGISASVGGKTGFFHLARRFWTNSPGSWDAVDEEDVVDLDRF